MHQWRKMNEVTTNINIKCFGLSLWVQFLIDILCIDLRKKDKTWMKQNESSHNKLRGPCVAWASMLVSQKPANKREEMLCNQLFFCSWLPSGFRLGSSFIHPPSSPFLCSLYIMSWLVESLTHQPHAWSLLSLHWDPYVSPTFDMLLHVTAQSHMMPYRKLIPSFPLHAKLM